MKIAFVYDRVNKFGGAERVLQSLHEIWPDAPLFTSVYDPNGAPWAKDFDVRTSFLQTLPWLRTHHEPFGWLMPLAFESLDFSKFDVVISVTSEAAKGVLTNSRQLHVCYLLTPTRYLWSHSREYLDMVPNVARPLAVSIQSKLRLWDFMAAQRPDYLIAISEHVRKRCQKFYRRDTEVIYPPISLREEGRGKREEGNYYLVVSRLVPYKRIDLAIAACQSLKAPLVIVGVGSDEERLRKLSGSTIRFAGYLTDEELISYYRRAKALLMPQEEDFGLVSIEAQSFGVPVISYRYSGAAEKVQGGKTGILFEKQSVESLVEAIQKLVIPASSRNLYGSRISLRSSGMTGNRSFQEKFRSTIEKLWKAHH